MYLVLPVQYQQIDYLTIILFTEVIRVVARTLTALAAGIPGRIPAYSTLNSNLAAMLLSSLLRP